MGEGRQGKVKKGVSFAKELKLCKILKLHCFLLKEGQCVFFSFFPL